MAKQKEQYKGVKRRNRTRLMELWTWRFFSYRNTPQSVTEHSPAELMFGCKLKLWLDQLHPDLNRKVQAKMIRKKECHDRGTKLCKFKIGDNVYLKNFHRETNGYLE